MKQYTQEDYYRSLSNTIEAMLVDSKYRNIRFYGMLLLTLQKEFKDYSEEEFPCRTAGLGLFNNNYKLVINKNFWTDAKNIDSHKRVGLLVHEVMHFIYSHITNKENYNDPSIYNEAVDLWVNSHIIKELGVEALPGYTADDWDDVYQPRLDTLFEKYQNQDITHEQYLEELNEIPVRPVIPSDYYDKDLTVDNICTKSTDWVYNKIYKLRKENKSELEKDSQNNSNDQNNTNSLANQNSKSTAGKSNNNLAKNPSHPSHHKEWEKILQHDEGVKKFIENNKNYILDKTAQEFEKAIGYEQLPQNIKDILNKLRIKNKPSIDYKAYIRKWISLYGNFTEIVQSKSKPNLIIEDGFRLKLKPDKSILIALDTSGSMNTYDIEEILNEAYNIYKVTQCKMDVIEVDNIIQNKWSIRDLQAFQKKIIDKVIYGGGGTEFDPVVNYINNNRNHYSGVIYLTDGYVNKPKSQIKLPLLVVLTSNGLSNLNWYGYKYKEVKIRKNN